MRRRWRSGMYLRVLGLGDWAAMVLQVPEQVPDYLGLMDHGD